MNFRIFLLTIFVCLMIPAMTPAQSVTRAVRSPIAATSSEAAGTAALAALQLLQSKVIAYRSLGEFEADGRLAYVTLQTFEQELLSATSQLQPILEAMAAGKEKTQLVNALASYRDGVYWWRKVDRPRVVHVSAPGFESNQSASDAVLMSTAPYTVAIHWRQAARYLRRAEALMGSR